MPGSLGLSHQVMNSLHQPCTAKVSSEEEWEKEQDGTSGSHSAQQPLLWAKRGTGSATARERQVAP